MTKIWCGCDGCGYLFAMIDSYDKNGLFLLTVLPDTDELLSAVNQTLEKHFPQGVKGRGLTIRSNNGCQMTSRRYVKALQFKMPELSRSERITTTLTPMFTLSVGSGR